MIPATAVGPHSTSLLRVAKRQDAGVDHYVKAFEAAWARSGPVAIEDFLPPPDDAAYARIVRELVRVDIEFCWDGGRPRDLDEYCRAFSEVFGDPAMLTAVAFEEYRQRRDHGQAPEPAEFARKYGVDTADWPLAEAPRTVVVDGATGLAAASHIYREFAADRGDLETAVTPGAAGDALDLFRAIHEADPTAARRLADATLALPDAGEVFQGFRLEAELGRAHLDVYSWRGKPCWPTGTSLSRSVPPTCSAERRRTNRRRSRNFSTQISCPSIPSTVQGYKGRLHALFRADDARRCHPRFARLGHSAGFGPTFDQHRQRSPALDGTVQIFGGFGEQRPIGDPTITIRGARTASQSTTPSERRSPANFA